MSNPVEEEGEEERKGSDNDDDNNNNAELSQEWETMARAWLCSFPEAKAVSMEEVEAWIDSNYDSLPKGIKSMPRSDVCQRLISIQNCIRLPTQEKDSGEVSIPRARFQRTDQWRPVYSWLETLNRDEVVKSKDIADWLTENPTVREELCSRHSRYHLMHYIKKCHMKILKRRERRKGMPLSDKPAAVKVNKDVVMKQPALIPSNSSSNLPKDSEAYLAKRKEALQKYQILVELERLLIPSKGPEVNK